jgi:hypothetical protein
MENLSWDAIRGVIIGVVVGVGVFYIYYLSYRVKKLETYSSFSPRSIIIFPNWDQLLVDHHIIEKGRFEEIYKQCEEDGKFSESQYHVLNNGINFTVLRRDEYSDLIYDNGRKRFRSDLFREIFIGETINEIEQPYPEGMLHFDEPYHPGIYIKEVLDGFRLCLSSLNAPNNDGLIRITTIPKDYLFTSIDTNTATMEQAKKIDKKIDEGLEKYGWKVDSTFSCIRHKYFRVHIEYI